jgi:hypothetical protein
MRRTVSKSRNPRDGPECARAWAGSQRLGWAKSRPIQIGWLIPHQGMTGSRATTYEIRSCRAGPTRGRRRTNDPRWRRISNSSAGRVRCARRAILLRRPVGRWRTFPHGGHRSWRESKHHPSQPPRVPVSEGRGAAHDCPDGSPAYRSSPARANRRGGHAARDRSGGNGVRHQHQETGHPGQPGGGTSASATTIRRRWNWRGDASARDGRGRGRFLQARRGDVYCDSRPGAAECGSC